MSPKFARLRGKKDPQTNEIDPKWINLDTIRSWMNTCRKDHVCLDYTDFGSPPTWLIDVCNECLISPAATRGRVRYCALSYVWGGVESSRLSTASVHEFSQPGAFSVSRKNITIPKTVRHAMNLVRALGEKYLWVDALCIVQDDSSQLSHELRNMGAIYNDAYLTIVAATAWDADEGLRGLRNITPPRHISNDLDADLQTYVDPESMVWASRGWTFQEEAFSRRMLLFCDQTVVWRCASHTTGETEKSVSLTFKRVAEGWTRLGIANTILQEQAPTGISAELRKWRLTRKWPGKQVLKRFDAGEERDEGESDLDVALRVYFSAIVQQLNTRQFTYPSDLPRAFDGIAFYLEKTAPPNSLFAQGLCWGLPISHFLKSLAWSSSGEDLRPRTLNPKPPSWSWYNFEGLVTPTCERDRSSFPYLKPKYYRPMCRWTFAKGPSRLQTEDVLPSAASSQCVEIVGEMSKIPIRKMYEDGDTSTDDDDFTGPDEFRAIYPDRHDDDYKSPHIELLGLYRFDAGKRGAKMQTFMKALWIAHDDGNLEGAVPVVYRRGVAIVNWVTWKNYLTGYKNKYLLA